MGVARRGQGVGRLGRVGNAVIHGYGAAAYVGFLPFLLVIALSSPVSTSASMIPLYRSVGVGVEIHSNIGKGEGTSNLASCFVDCFPKLCI